ncbi:phosphatidylinositolglycan protein [Trifolium repens]|nr:phosphatidylinositolglycan protein [Trifolium repens]
MVEFSISNARYTYVHDQKYPSENADIHHIILRRNGSKYFFVYASALLVLACAIYLYFLEEKSISLVYYSLLFDIFLVKLLLRKPVNKESVVIMPAFGVQLETHYMSGKVVRCFVPIDKILKPNLRPPIKMLVRVWKALCAATDNKEETSEILAKSGSLF